MKNKILGLVAVRLDSQRLEGKAFLNLYYKKTLIRLVERVSKSKHMDDLAICTSTHSSDNAIEKLSMANNIKIFRGSKKNVMSRFIYAGKLLGAKHVIRITGDNPLTDPRIIDLLIIEHLKNNNEYTFSSNSPVGTSAEVIKLKTLIKCHKNLIDPNSSEYMSWMLNRPDILKVQDVKCPTSISKSNNISFTIDEKFEYENIKKIYNYFKGDPPNLNNIINWIKKNPILLKRMTKEKNTKKIKNVNCKFKFDKTS